MAAPALAAILRMAGTAARTQLSKIRKTSMLDILTNSGGSKREFQMGDIKLEMSPKHVNRTIREMRRDSRAIKSAATKGTRAAADVLFEAVLKNISSTKHSLRQLADMDHPYARRHGSTRISSMKPYEIHDQSGRLRSALTKSRLRTGALVEFDTSKAPHAKYVVSGTRTMVQRDVIHETMAELSVKREMKKAVVNAIRKRGRGGKFKQLDFTWSFK